MVISEEEFENMSKYPSERAKDLKELYNEMINKLDFLGKKLGFLTKKEFKADMGRIDFLWFLKKSGFGHIPVVGFEIETSWRTRKHLKGDVFNLLSLSPSIGIILLLKSGFSNKFGDKESAFEGNLKAIKKYVDSFSGVAKLEVWIEDDVNRLYHEINKK